MAVIPVPGGVVASTLSDWLNGQDVERMSRYREFLDFYEGQQWPRRRRAGETQLTFNYARTLIRKAASYVFSKPVTFSVPAGEGISDEQAAAVERRINAFHHEQDLHTLDFQTLVDASVLGDGAFKVIWDPATGQPVVSSVDPSGLWAWTEPANVRALRRVVQRYHLRAVEAAEVFGVDVVATAETAVVPVVEDWTAERLVVEVGGSIVRDEPNTYGYIPYVLFPNIAKPHQVWGESDLADLLSVCREINRRMTVISRILQVSGNPIVVLENVTGSEGIRADEGAIWELPEDSRAYLLDVLQGGGLDLHIKYVDLLYRAMHDIAETPRTSFGDSGRTLSGAALEVEIQPLVQKVHRKRRIWDSVYRRRNWMILDQLQRFGGEPLGGVRRTVTLWPQILPDDREALVRSEVSLVANQIHSRQTAMAVLGEEDNEGEWARILTEAAALPGRQLARDEGAVDDDPD